MRKILVTGAAGFIGFHLVSRLMRDRSVEVVGIDNINSYYNVKLKKARLKILEKEGKGFGYVFKKIDISEKKEVDKLFAEYKFNMVINLAAQAGVRYSIDNPDAYIESNIVGYMNILEGCRRHGVEHLLYASSSSVYGINEKIPFSENDFVDNPISLYAATKKSNELMAHTYSHLYGIKTTGLRFFTVYGPYGRPDMAYYKFTKSIFEGLPIEVFNNGDMQRDFTYIDDVIDGMLALIDRSFYDKKESNREYNNKFQIYNIGNNNPEKLSRFIEIIEKEVGKEAIKINKPMQMGDVYITFADIEKIKNYVGYSPSTKITDGLRKFVEWYREYYEFKS